MERFVLSRKVNAVDGQTYLKLGKNVIVIDRDVIDRAISESDMINYCLRDVNLIQETDNCYRITKGKNNIFILEYRFQTSDWCGFYSTITKNNKFLTFKIKNSEWPFITETAGIIVETPIDYTIAEMFRKKDGVWNRTQTYYVYADFNNIKILDCVKSEI